MGHIAPLRNRCRNKLKQETCLCKQPAVFINISPSKNAWPFICINWNLFHLKMLVPSLIKIGPVIIEKEIFKSSKYFWYFCYYLPLLNPPYPRPNLVEICLLVLEKFKKFTDRQQIIGNQKSSLVLSAQMSQ